MQKSFDIQEWKKGYETGVRNTPIEPSSINPSGASSGGVFDIKKWRAEYESKGIVASATQKQSGTQPAAPALDPTSAAIESFRQKQLEGRRPLPQNTAEWTDYDRETWRIQNPELATDAKGIQTADMDFVPALTGLAAGGVKAAIGLSAVAGAGQAASQLPVFQPDEATPGYVAPYWQGGLMSVHAEQELGDAILGTILNNESIDREANMRMMGNIAAVQDEAQAAKKTKFGLGVPQQVVEMLGPMAEQQIQSGMGAIPGYSQLRGIDYWFRQGVGAHWNSTMKGRDLSKFSDDELKAIRDEAVLMGAVYASVEYASGPLGGVAKGMGLPIGPFVQKMMAKNIARIPGPLRRKLVSFIIGAIGAGTGEAVEEGVQRMTEDPLENTVREIENSKLPDGQKKPMLTALDSLREGLKEFGAALPATILLSMVTGAPDLLKNDAELTPERIKEAQEKLQVPDEIRAALKTLETDPENAEATAAIEAWAQQKVSEVGQGAPVSEAVEGVEAADAQPPAPPTMKELLSQPTVEHADQVELDDAFEAAGIERGKHTAVDSPTTAPAQLANRIAEALGKRVVWYQGNLGQTVINGFTKDGAVFLNANGADPINAVVVHEVTHTMRRDAPDLYRQLSEAIESASGDDSFEKFRAIAAMGSSIYSGMSDEKLRDEYVAHIMGKRGTEAEFWQRVFDGKDQGFIRQVVEAINQIIQTITDAVGFGKGTGIDADPLLNNMVAVRDAAVTAMRGYIEVQQQQQPQQMKGGGAYGLQEGQGRQAEVTVQQAQQPGQAQQAAPVQPAQVAQQPTSPGADASNQESSFPPAAPKAQPPAPIKKQKKTAAKKPAKPSKSNPVDDFDNALPAKIPYQEKMAKARTGGVYDSIRAVYETLQGKINSVDGRTKEGRALRAAMEHFFDTETDYGLDSWMSEHANDDEPTAPLRQVGLGSQDFDKLADMAQKSIDAFVAREMGKDEGGNSEDKAFMAQFYNDSIKAARNGVVVPQDVLSDFSEQERAEIEGIGKSEKSPYLYATPDGKEHSVFKDENGWHIKNKDGKWVAVGNDTEAAQELDDWIEQANRPELQLDPDEVPFSASDKTNDDIQAIRGLIRSMRRKIDRGYRTGKEVSELDAIYEDIIERLDSSIEDVSVESGGDANDEEYDPDQDTSFPSAEEELVQLGDRWDSGDNFGGAKTLSEFVRFALGDTPYFLREGVTDNQIESAVRDAQQARTDRAKRRSLTTEKLKYDVQFSASDLQELKNTFPIRPTLKDSDWSDETEFARWEKKYEDFEEKLKDWASRAPAVLPLVKMRDDKNGLIHLVSKNTRGGNPWRYTTFAIKDGKVDIDPYGHEEFKTKYEAVKEPAQNGYKYEPEIMFSAGRRETVTPEQDAEYLAAVERGDTETAQKMVDEAAKKAGYNVGPVWHSTDKEFNAFDRSKVAEGNANRYGPAFYFTANAREKVRETPTPRQFRVYLNAGRVLDFDASTETRFPIRLINAKTPAEAKAILNDMGYDSFRKRFAYDFYVGVYDAERIKSADAVTRDDQGRVIPLSERFNPGSNDIRFSAVDDVAESGENDPSLFGEDTNLEEDHGMKRHAGAEKFLRDPRHANLPSEVKRAALDALYRVIPDQEALGRTFDALAKHGLEKTIEQFDQPDANIDNDLRPLLGIAAWEAYMQKGHQSPAGSAEQQSAYETANAISRRIEDVAEKLGRGLRYMRMLHNRHLSDRSYAQYFLSHSQEEYMRLGIPDEEYRELKKTVEELNKAKQDALDQLKVELGSNRHLKELLKNAKDSAEREYVSRLSKLGASTAQKWHQDSSKLKVLKDTYTQKLSALSRLGIDIKAPASAFSTSDTLSQAQKSDLVELATGIYQSSTMGDNTAISFLNIGQNETAQDAFLRFLSDKFAQLSQEEARDIWAAGVHIGTQEIQNIDQGRTAGKATRKRKAKKSEGAELLEQAKGKPEAEAFTPEELAEMRSKKSVQAIKILDELKNLGVRMQDIIKMQYGERQEIGEMLVNELVRNGVVPKDAAKIAIAVKDEFNRIVDERIAKVKEKAKGHARKTAIEKLAAAIKTNAFNYQAGMDMFARMYGLRGITKEFKARFEELQQELSKAAGIYGVGSVQTDKANEKLVRFVAQHFRKTGIVGLPGVVQSTLIGNMLSGPLTHGVNIISTLERSIATWAEINELVIGRLLKDPKKGRELMRLFMTRQFMSLAEGAKAGQAMARIVMKTGITPPDTAGKYEADYSKTSTVEIHPFFNAGGKLNPMYWMRYVGRALRAEDLLSRFPMRELEYLYLTITELQDNENLSGAALEEEVAKRMGYWNDRSNSAIAAAEKKFAALGLKGAELTAEAMRAVEALRPQEGFDKAVSLSMEDTFNAKNPHGIPGLLSEIADVTRKFPGGWFLSLFARIAANVTNYMIDTSPLGAIRLGINELSGGKEYISHKNMVKMTPQRKARQAVRALNGTLITLALIARVLFKDDDDDEDGFDVVGYGPRDQKLRETWKRNHKPFSVRFFKGGKYYSMAFLGPLASPFLWAGAVLDEKRYGNYKDEDVPDRALATRMAMSIMPTMLDFISRELPAKTMFDLSKIMYGDRPDSIRQTTRNFLSGLGQSAIPYSGMVRFFDRLQDPTVYTDKTKPLYYAMLRNVPFVRQEYMMPYRTIFGEPIKYEVLDRFFDDIDKDPDIDFLVKAERTFEAPRYTELMVPVVKDGVRGGRLPTDKEYDKLLVFFGEELRKRVENIRKRYEKYPDRVNKENKNLEKDLSRARQDAMTAGRQRFYRYYGYSIQRED